MDDQLDILSDRIIEHDSGYDNDLKENGDEIPEVQNIVINLESKVIIIENEISPKSNDDFSLE